MHTQLIYDKFDNFAKSLQLAVDICLQTVNIINLLAAAWNSYVLVLVLVGRGAVATPASSDQLYPLLISH